MNLGSGFQIGRSALSAGQNAMTVAGHNMANASTPGYRRQRIGMLAIAGPHQIGVGQVGAGVRTTTLSRAVDMALLARLRHAGADEAGLRTSHRLLDGVEQTLAATGEERLAGAVESFLKQWHELAASPSDPAMRSVIIERGVGLASQIRQLRSRVVEQRHEIDRSLQDAVVRVNQLLAEIESLTDRIRAAESAGGSNPSLRDQRDRLVDELSTLMDVVAVDRPDGTLDLLVGSTPIMLQGASLGVSLSITQLGATLAVTADGAPLAAGGSIGALAARRADAVEATIARLDRYAYELVNAVNRVHIEGRGLHGRTGITSFQGVQDPNLPLAQIPLQHPVTAGLIRFEVRAPGGENPIVVEISVDPANDSLAQVAADINAAAGGLSAFIDGSNRLVVTAGPGLEFSVLEDQTGLFTAIQFGGFFTGFNASDIAVAQELRSDPLLLSVARNENDAAVANAMAALADQAIPFFGTTLGDWWRLREAEIASRVRSAGDGAESASIVRLGLEAQERQVSGVSLDDEIMNLMAAQTQFEAAARFVSTLEEALRTLLAMAAR